MEFIASGILAEIIDSDYERVLGNLVYIGKVTVTSDGANKVSNGATPLIDR